MTTLHPHSIVAIAVRGLYGYIDQTLSASSDNRDAISRLAILYGENGTGKTTLLRLAFHLLSPRVDRGHKTRLAETPFQHLSITLRNGTKFKAERDDAVSGDFLFTVTPPKRQTLRHEFKVEPGDPPIRPYSFSKKMQNELSKCASTFVFLRDDRLIEIEPNATSPGPWDQPDPSLPEVVRRRRSSKIHRLEEEMIRFIEEPDQLGAALQASISRLERWFTVQYGQRTNTGMASSHAIYEQVINRVVSGTSSKDSSRTLESHVENLLKLAKESQVYETYGLSPLIDVDVIIENLRQADQQQTFLLQPLLAPYIDTIEARFFELRAIYETIDTFISQASLFLKPKHITYRVGEGLKVYSPKGDQLKPTELSSGERHLLLILCSAVLAGNNPTMFIVDEPEISLNTTWQRGLADALLAVSQSSVTQFVMASHSLPLIGNYTDHVMRLEHG